MILQTPTTQVSEAADTVATSFGRFWTDLLGRGDVWFDLALSAAVLLVIVLLRRLLLKVLDRHVEDVRLRYRWAKGTAYGAFIVVALLIVVIWTDGNLASLGTFLGLLTAGLAIALRDLVANVAGWLFILWRRPFDVGDRVQVGAFAGDVVDLRVLQFTILEIGNWVDADQTTGRIIHIPNQKVFSEPQANYTAQFEYLWNEIAVLLTFESDWRKAKEILTGIAQTHASGMIEEAERSVRRASRKFMIFYPNLSPIVYTNVKDSGVELTIRYLCKPRARRGTAEKIWEDVLQAFADHDDIDFAYPTTRAYINPVEGKPGARQELPGRPPPAPPDRQADPGVGEGDQS